MLHLLRGIAGNSVIDLIAGLLFLLLLLGLVSSFEFFFLFLLFILVIGERDGVIDARSVDLGVDGCGVPASMLLCHRLRVGGELPRGLRGPLLDLRLLVGALRFEFEIWIHDFVRDRRFEGKGNEGFMRVSYV